MANTQFSFRLDTELKSKLKQEAQHLNRSESYIAATAIEKYLLACEQKRKAIDLAVKQAEQGDFISSEAMGAWIDSWGTANELNPPEANLKNTN